MSAGVLLFVHRSMVPRFEDAIKHLNARGRVSEEVLRLYMITPTRADAQTVSDTLRTDPTLQELEKVSKLKPNNSLRDLTAPWRLHPSIVENYKLVVGLETVNPDFRQKYPIPNLTLQAGSIEEGETPMQAGLRELMEEARVVIPPQLLVQRPIGLLGKGMLMYPCFVGGGMRLTMKDDHLHIEAASAPPPRARSPEHVPDESQPHPRTRLAPLAPPFEE
jgi:8-oxo-dGTP pyrophosphatase MutT (NUDIX family)